MANVYVEARPKGRPEGSRIDDYVVETQGDQVRVSGKKRDDLQSVISGLREEDFGIPLQFENFRD